MIKTTDFSGNVQVIEYSVYPGGEITLATRVNEFDIEEIFAHITSADDLMALCQVSDIILKFSPNAFLTLPYVPYARQDRVIDDTIGGQCLSIKVFARIINSLQFKEVIVYDAHSNVSVALIDNCTNVSKREIYNLDSYLFEDGKASTVFVAPDQGALKSVEEVSAFFKYDYTFGLKKRNPETGRISYTQLINPDLLNDKHVVVVDDICDGGATFIELAKLIKSSSNPKTLVLSVTHGIFSKGLHCIFDAGYDKIISRFTFSKYRKDNSMNSFDVFTKKDL